MTFDSPAALWAGLAMTGVAVGIAAYRRPLLPALTKALGLAALVLLAFAAGGPSWRGTAGGPVVVMVDLSPSTRGAQYRIPSVLRERVGQLLGSTPYQIVYFAGGEGAASPIMTGVGEPLADLPADRTTWSPSPAAAILLFSDARFDLPPVAPPTYVVVDPALEGPDDAAVERIETRGTELVVAVRNSRESRELIVGRPGERLVARENIAPGGAVITRPMAPASGELTARLSPGDRWPENDGLSLVPAPPAEAERWWVTRRGARDGWRVWSPVDLPLETAAYLGSSVIVLDNVAASDLGDARLRRLAEYVTDLGGGLVILGGDAAFAAGGYSGTALDAVSPLASHPPEPSTHWVFLIDSSGSMNAPATGGTRWSAAVGAAARAGSTLPPDDLVSVAGFAAAVDWWLRGKAASEIAADTIPPRGARASGPTELRRALESAAQAGGDGPPVELVVLTDANAPVEDPAGLAALLRRRKVRLHLLDIGDTAGPGLAALREVVAATGGTLLRESAPAQWAAAVRRLTDAAAPSLVAREAHRVTFTGPLAGLPSRTVPPPWNRTWLKSRATTLTAGDFDPGPRAAHWNVGEGRAVAAAFGASPVEAEAFARLAARPPRDPALRVTWDAAALLHVTIDASTRSGDGAGSGYLNGVPLTLEVRDGSAPPGGGAGVRVPQVAPGRYELAVPAPRVPSLATLRREGRVVERVAVAGRYAPEFEAVGNNRHAMRELAGRTGGAVIEPSFTGRIHLEIARRSVSFTSISAAAAAGCLAVALIRWRRG